MLKGKENSRLIFKDKQGTQSRKESFSRSSLKSEKPCLNLFEINNQKLILELEKKSKIFKENSQKYISYLSYNQIYSKLFLNNLKAKEII